VFYMCHILFSGKSHVGELVYDVVCPCPVFVVVLLGVCNSQ